VLLGFVVGLGHSALRAGLFVHCECPRVRCVACAGALNTPSPLAGLALLEGLVVGYHRPSMNSSCLGWAPKDKQGAGQHDVWEDDAL
jgi:hypothetical protein